jgi:hypothetical protein
MNLITLKTASVLLAGAALLGGCGGGGDDNAGSVTPFSIVPDEVKITDSTNGCSTGTTGQGAETRVYVYGGAAPYRIDNVFPDAIELDRTRVENRGDFFIVRSLGGCVSGEAIVVVDANDRQVVLTYEVTDEDSN